MTTGIDCRVYVDGERMPDGSIGDDEFAPTALSGLKITWGRSTTLDQPEPASCTFDVLDVQGGDAFIEVLRTGLTVDVVSTGIETSGGDVPLMADPSFEAGASGAIAATVPTNATVRYQTTYHTVPGAQSVSMIAIDPSAPFSAAFPPAPFSAAVDGWDAIPTAQSGEAWMVGATVRAPAGSRVTVAPVLFPIASGAGAQILEGVAITGSGDWETVDVAFVPTVSGQWVGVAVLADLLPRWVDQIDTVTRTNLAPNPNFETDASGWTLEAGGVLTRDTTAPISGAASGKLVGTGTAGDVYKIVGAGEGDFVTFSVDYKTPGPVTGAPRIYLGQSGGTPIGSKYNYLPLDQPAPGRFSVTLGPLGANANGAIAAVFAPTSAFLWFDNATIERGSAATPYFDGSSPATGVFRYAWTGAPNVSTSQEIRVASWAAALGSWLDYEHFSVDDLVVSAPSGGTVRTVSVFSGRITDLDAAFDQGLDSPVVHVTAQDFTADLANVDIGDEPWTVESMKDRFLRIVALSGFDLTSIIDDSVAAIPVSYQDVDAQPAAGLLRDLAQSVDGVLWPAVHATTGAYLRVEDPGNRSALFTLEMGADGVVEIVPRGSAADVLDISACDVLRDPVRWQQSVADVSTRVAVEWLEQAVDGDGLPTTNSHTQTLIDPELEAAHGKRRISVSTILTTSADADSVATRILARTGASGWRVSGFQIVDDASIEVVDGDTVRMMMQLLDGTSRIGLPIRLVDLPVWAPTAPTVGVYLEGGDYEFVGGTWSLSLTVSNAIAVGESLPWVGVPAAWAWADFDPAISWLDMVGVAAPSEG